MAASPTERIAAAVLDERAAGREVVAWLSCDDGLSAETRAAVWREHIRLLTRTCGR